MRTTKDHYFAEFYILSMHCCVVRLHRGSAAKWDRGIKIFLAVTSSASIGAWAIWREFAPLWAGLIALSQVVSAINTYLPFNERARQLTGLSIALEELLVHVEAKWLVIASDVLNEVQMQKALEDLRAKKTRATHK